MTRFEEELADASRVHPSADVATDAVVGAGVHLGPGCKLQNTPWSTSRRHWPAASSSAPLPY